MDRKIITKIFKYILFTSFITFFALYLSVSAGYYEYKSSKKVALTNSQIKEFEKDISKGKNIDIKKYIEANNNNYNNKLSNTGLSISKKTQKFVQTIIDESFKFLSKLVGE